MHSLIVAIVAMVVSPLLCAAESAPFAVEAKIPLGDVQGRIDHLAIDIARQRLYVAELGNNTVGVVDLKERKLLRNLTGLDEPQGIAYVPSTDTVYVANAGDGSVQLFDADLKSTGRIALGADADNVRVDTIANRIYVGYGNGALAVLDPSKRSRIGDIALKSHPESFQLESSGQRIFVNVPDAHEIAIVDRGAANQRQSWPQATLQANFPMALDEPNLRVLVVFRNPAMLAAFDTNDGALMTSTPTCGDSDDVFVDRKRERVYVTCGEGFVDIFERRNDAYMRTGHFQTVPGARTSLFVPDLDLLLVAVRSTHQTPATIWVLRPTGA